MGNRIKNVIYILTNQQYPGYVKIGYASDLLDRLNTLNTGALIGFQAYGVMETDIKNADIHIHEIIGLLNPLLRAKDLSDGKEHNKEFFKLEAPEAFELLKRIASIYGFEDKVYRLTNNRREKPVNCKYQEEPEIQLKLKNTSTPTSYIICRVGNHDLALNTKFTSYENFIYDLCKFCIKEYSLELFRSVVLSESGSYKSHGYFNTITNDDYYHLKIADDLYLCLPVNSLDVYTLTLASTLCETFNRVIYSINY